MPGPVLRQPPRAFGAQAFHGGDIRMLLDEARKRRVRDARGIETRALGAGPVDAAAVQGIEPVARFERQRADCGA